MKSALELFRNHYIMIVAHADIPVLTQKGFEKALVERDKEWTDKIKEAIKEETYFRAQEALKKLLDNKDKND